MQPFSMAKWFNQSPWPGSEKISAYLPKSEIILLPLPTLSQPAGMVARGDD
jgi:hypothetical protein